MSWPLIATWFLQILSSALGKKHATKVRLVSIPEVKKKKSLMNHHQALPLLQPHFSSCYSLDQLTRDGHENIIKVVIFGNFVLVWECPSLALFVFIWYFPTKLGHHLPTNYLFIYLLITHIRKVNNNFHSKLHIFATFFLYSINLAISRIISFGNPWVQLMSNFVCKNHIVVQEKQKPWTPNFKPLIKGLLIHLKFKEHLMHLTIWSQHLKLILHREAFQSTKTCRIASWIH